MLTAWALVFSHPITWLITAIGCACYARLLFLYAHRRHLFSDRGNRVIANQTRVLKILISTLPLLGLLGTIMGIQRSFSYLAGGASGSEQVTAGISDALFTTYVGLAFAITGWVLLWFVTTQCQRYLLESRYGANG